MSHELASSTPPPTTSATPSSGPTARLLSIRGIATVVRLWARRTAPRTYRGASRLSARLWRSARRRLAATRRTCGPSGRTTWLRVGYNLNRGGWWCGCATAAGTSVSSQRGAAAQGSLSRPTPQTAPQAPSGTATECSGARARLAKQGFSALLISCLFSCGTTQQSPKLILRESVTLRDTTVVIAPPTYTRVLTAHWLADSTELYASTVEPGGDTSARVRIKFRRDSLPQVELTVTPPPTTHTVTYPSAVAYTVEVPEPPRGVTITEALAGLGASALIAVLFYFVFRRNNRG